MSLSLVFIALKFSNKRKKLEVSLDKQIEKYISECDSYISMLYKMYLNNNLITKLAEKIFNYLVIIQLPMKMSMLLK